MNVFEDLIEELRDENLLEETIIELGHAAGKPASARRSSSVEFVDNGSPEASDSLTAAERGHASASSDEEGDDFYRKRAMEEVSSLQMVEHVLSGIEREHMKSVPSAYDDLQAKKALHRFLQVQDDTTSTEYSEAEFQLMRETEAWNTALAARDKRISVANLRRFCENSRPVLSSQALIALARFYRNSAFSELTRAKFEFVMTRLFSRETESQKRRVLFGRAEMVGHIKTLYANWSSLALYSTEDVPVKTRAIVAGFDDRAAEAESATTFDELIQNDFFRKIHEFKEATGEMFFTPEVVASTIECNTKVGNRFIDLIQLERETMTLESVEQKYGYEYDQIVSDAAGKTLQLVDVLKNLPGAASNEEAEHPSNSKPRVSTSRKPEVDERTPFFSLDIFSANKWLLMATVLVVLASVGMYFWGNQTSTESSPAESAKDVRLDNSGLQEYVKLGRATSETFYAITLPSWDQLPEAKRKEVLQRALEFANSNGLKNVNLVNARGKNMAFASKTKLEVFEP